MEKDRTGKNEHYSELTGHRLRGKYARIEKILFQNNPQLAFTPHVNFQEPHNQIAQHTARRSMKRPHSGNRGRK